MFLKLFGISFHIFAPTRESKFFLCRNLMKLMRVYSRDVNLMSLKSSKYLSVHFFRLCRALSLRRIQTLEFTKKRIA